MPHLSRFSKGGISRSYQSRGSIRRHFTCRQAMFFRTLKTMEVHFTPEQQAQIAQIATKWTPALKPCSSTDARSSHAHPLDCPSRR